MEIEGTSCALEKSALSTCLVIMFDGEGMQRERLQHSTFAKLLAIVIERPRPDRTSASRV